MCAENREQTPICKHTKNERAILGTWATPELHLALETGYSIISIHEVWNWGNRKGTHLFRNYMMKWMELKIKSSPIPTDETLGDYIDSLNREYDLDLSPEDMVPNAAMRSLGKLGISSSKT